VHPGRLLRAPYTVVYDRACSIWAGIIVLGEGNPTDREKTEIEEQIYELKLQKEDYVLVIETLETEKGMKYFESSAPEY